MSAIPGSGPGPNPLPQSASNNRPITNSINNRKIIQDLQNERNKLMRDIQNLKRRLKGKMTTTDEEQIVELQKRLALCEDNFFKRFGRSFEDYYRDFSMSFSKTKNELIIAGERVYMLDDAPTAPEGIVTFQKYYFPMGFKNPENLAKAKAIFKVIFDDVVDKDEIPAPICTKDENNFLLKGLKNRFKSLREEVKKRRNDFGDSLYSRQALEHFLRLKKMIDAYEDKLIRCIDPDILDDGYSGPSNPLDPDDIESLLRTFTFMILQSINPSGDHDKSSESQQLIEFLKNNEVPSQQLQGLIDHTRDIPGIILDIANISENGRSTHLDRAADGRLQEIVQELVSMINNENLGHLIQGLDVNEPRDFIIRIFQKIIGEYNKCRENSERLYGKKEVNRQQIDICRSDLSTVREKLAKLHTQSQVSSIDKEADKKAHTETAIEPLRKKIIELEEQIAAYERANSSLGGLIDEEKSVADKYKVLFTEISVIFDNETDTTKLLQKIRDAKQNSDAIAGLEGEISGLKAQIQTLNSQAPPEVVDTALAAQATAEKDAKIAELTAQITEKEGEISRLTNENIEFANKNTGYEKQILELQDMVTNLNNKLTVAQKEHGEKTTDSEGKDSRIKELEAEIEQLKPLLGSKDTADTLNTKLTELEGQLKRAVAQNDAIKKEKMNIQLQIVQLQSQLTSANNKLTAAKAQAIEDDKTITQLKAQIDALYVDYRALIKEHGTLKEQHDGKIKQIAGSDEKIAALNADIDSHKKELDKLQNTTISLNQLKSENDTLKSRIADKHEKQKELELKIADLTSQINESTTAKSRLEQERDNIKTSLDEAQVRIKELISTNAELTDKIKKLTQDKRDQQHTIDSLDEKLVLENKKYEDNLNKAKEAKEHLITKVKALTQSLADFNGTKLELDELKKQHTSAKTELDGKTTKIAELTEKMATVSALNEEVNKLRNSALDNKELQRQIDALNMSLQAMNEEKVELQKSDAKNKGIIQKLPILLENIQNGKSDGFIQGDENDQIFIDILKEVNGKLGITEDPKREIQVKNLCLFSYFAFYFLEAIFHQTPDDMKRYIKLVKGPIFHGIKELFKNLVPDIKDEEVYYEIIMCLSNLFYAAEYYVLSDTATPSVVLYKEDIQKATTRSGIIQILIQSLESFQINESNLQFFDIYKGISYNSVKENFTYFLYNRDNNDQLSENKIFIYDGKNTSIQDMSKPPSNIDKKPSDLTYDVAFRIFLIAAMQFLENKKSTLIELKCSLPFNYLGTGNLLPSQGEMGVDKSDEYDMNFEEYTNENKARNSLADATNSKLLAEAEYKDDKFESPPAEVPEENIEEAKVMTREIALELFGFGVNYKPTVREIEKKYKKLALVRHPNKGGTTKEMQWLNSAKDLLLKLVVGQSSAKSPVEESRSEPANMGREGMAQLGDVRREGVAQLGDVRREGMAQLGDVRREGMAQLGDVRREGMAQLGDVRREGMIQNGKPEASPPSQQQTVTRPNLRNFKELSKISRKKTRKTYNNAIYPPKQNAVQNDFTAEEMARSQFGQQSSRGQQARRITRRKNAPKK